MMNIKKLFVTALLSGLAAVTFAQSPAAGSGATAHTSHKKAASASKAKPHHKAKHAKKHHSTRQHAKKKAHTQRAGNANKSGSAGPGLQAY